MVYDEQREVVLLHGGRLQDGTVLSDTWQWDGQTWTLLATNGPKVFQHSMAYDPSRGVTVLYGGRTAAGHADPIGDTWEWDGQTWTQIADGFLRGGHSLVFDPVRGKMIAFGGSSSSNTSPSPGTWEFDGDQWNLITTEGPLPRFTFDRALVWDVYRNVGVLYGGAASGSTWYGDTWEWDGTRWQQVNGPGPGRRGMHAMAYDAKRRTVVLFGGWRDCFRCEINETWEYGLPRLRLDGITAQGIHLEIRWTGGAPPYQVQSRPDLAQETWRNEGQPTDATSVTVQAEGTARFFRVLSLPGHTP